MYFHNVFVVIFSVYKHKCGGVYEGQYFWVSDFTRAKSSWRLVELIYDQITPTHYKQKIN